MPQHPPSKPALKPVSSLAAQPASKPVAARLRLALVLAAVLLAPEPAMAASLDGASLSVAWALPFVGILLTIALGPVFFAKFWHRHYGKFSLLWALLTLVPLAALHGAHAALESFSHAVIAEYLDFISILFALYVVAGGVLVTGTLRGTPLVNAALLAFGTLIASVIGTTGAAMILIRPLLRANAGRPHNVHVVVFFIFLVGNIGGALSPLGDPPLFIGFLNGVDFFWPLQHLWRPTLFVAACVLAIFVLLDLWYLRRERGSQAVVTQPATQAPLEIHGLVNLLLLAIVVAAVIVSAIWSPGISFDVFGTPALLQNLGRDLVLVGTALLSLWLTPDEHREANGFSFEPIIEVAILFAGIFVCAGPVLTMLDAGRDGAFAWLIAAVTAQDGTPHNVAYFWLTGLLSAILDNAPTYLVFFNLAGGKAAALMGPLASTLAAISMGAVYMGALTYIGNAPNFMIYAIAEDRGVRMPSFFGYMAWSVTVLVPVFVALTLLFVW
jgi:Na+/H+ antiporter NhaD/arsenite permease-like protein